jgi:3-deoxy-D-manno-octulosonic-acid transferase
MNGRGWLLLGGYRLLALALTPVWLALLLMRLVQGKEDPRRLVERLGWPTRRRPPGPLVWFHCASVGELNSLLPVLRQLGPLPVLLVTTVTRTSAALAARVLPAGVIHQYVPIDHWLAMLLFRSYWRPRLGVLAEAELWPELMLAMPHLLLINARMSERSYQRHRRHPWYAAWLLAAVEVCLAQSQADAERFRRLGVRDARALGSTKLDAEPLPVNAVHLSRLRQAFAGRPVLLLASSHPGEEQQWLEAWAGCDAASRPVALLLAPRHPQRAPGVRVQAAAQGFTVALWSELLAGATPPHPDVVVADVIGEMGVWISAATVVVMGGSFYPMGQPHGGQNPLEPVALGRPVLCGPDMANFSDLIEPLIEAGCLQQHPDVATTLVAALALLASAPAQADADPSPLPVRPQLRGPSQLVASLVRDRCR